MYRISSYSGWFFLSSVSTNKYNKMYWKKNVVEHNSMEKLRLFYARLILCFPA